MSTLNPATWHGLAHLGAVAPGYQADLLLLPDLERFVPGARAQGVAGRSWSPAPAIVPGLGAPVRPDRAARPADLPRSRGRAAGARDRARARPDRHGVARRGAGRRGRVGGRRSRARPREDRRRRAAPRHRPDRARLRPRLRAAARRARLDGRARRAQRRRRRTSTTRRWRSPVGGCRLGGGIVAVEDGRVLAECRCRSPASSRTHRSTNVIAQSRALRRRRARARLRDRVAVPDARVPRALRDPDAEDHRPRPRRRRPLRARAAACRMTRHAAFDNGWIVTMDDAGSEHPDGWVLVADGRIARSAGASPPGERVELGGAVVTPGLVNTHHHLYQTLTRARAQQADLFTWLHELYPLWPGSTPSRSTRRRAPGSRSSRCPAARPSSTTTTSSRAGRAGLIEAEVRGPRAGRAHRRLARLDGPRRLRRRAAAGRARRGARRRARRDRAARGAARDRDGRMVRSRSRRARRSRSRAA